MLPEPRDDGQDPNELLELAQKFVDHMRASGSPFHATKVVIKYRYVEPRLRASYHEVTEEIVRYFRLLSADGKSTRYAISEHLQLIRWNMLSACDLEGRMMLTKPSGLGGQQYFMAPKLVVPWSMAPRELADLLRTTVANINQGEAHV